MIKIKGIYSIKYTFLQELTSLYRVTFANTEENIAGSGVEIMGDGGFYGDDLSFIPVLEARGQS